MRANSLRPYLLNCGLLLLPVFLWNLAFVRWLPPAFERSEFWREIPLWVAWPENFFRLVVSALPFLMPFEIASAMQRRGLLLYAIGVALYFAAWAALMIAPQSRWAGSPAGLLAPAVTPLVWLAGLALLGQRLHGVRAYRWWMFLVPSAAFLFAHVGHTWIVYLRTAGRAAG